MPGAVQTLGCMDAHGSSHSWLLSPSGTLGRVCSSRAREALGRVSERRAFISLSRA